METTDDTESTEGMGVALNGILTPWVNSRRTRIASQGPHSVCFVPSVVFIYGLWGDSGRLPEHAPYSFRGRWGQATMALT